MGGWYSGPYANVFGRILGAYARMYKADNDLEAKSKAEFLLEEWAKCIEPDGYCFYVKENEYPVPEVLGIQFQIEYDYLLQGLLDLYEYTNNANALKYAEKVTIWAIKNLSRDIYQSEGYHLSQPLYRAFILTNNIIYKNLADQYIYKDFWDEFIKKDLWDELSRGKKALLGKHVFSHIESLNAAALAYITTSNEKYFQIIKNAITIINNEHLFATGLLGPHEHFVSDIKKSLEFDEWGNTEVSCDSWAAVKLLKYLLCFTTDSKYGDWIEKIVYNGVGAMIPVKSDGSVMYFGKYFIGGAVKDYNGPGILANNMIDAWTCCTGTYPLNLTEYHDLIYFRDEDSIYVNLFVPSRLKYKKDDANITIEQITTYPLGSDIKLVIQTDKSVNFNLKIRIPQWVNDCITLVIDGKTKVVDTLSGSWLNVNNNWENKHIINIKIPINLYFLPINLQYPNLCALLYGGIVLVCNIGGPLKGNQFHPSSWITKEKEDSLIFNVYGQCLKRNFRPYFELNECEKYFMYNYIENKF